MVTTAGVTFATTSANPCVTTRLPCSSVTVAGAETAASSLGAASKPAYAPAEASPKPSANTELLRNFRDIIRSSMSTETLEGLSGALRDHYKRERWFLKFLRFLSFLQFELKRQVNSEG